MFKKGVSLIVLTVTIAVMLILSVIVIMSGMDINKNTDYVKFKNNIELIEKNIRKEYLKGNIYGITLEDYNKNENNEQEEFNFTPEELEEKIEDIKKIYISLNIDAEKDKYYLLRKEDLANLGIKELYDDYLVNYEKTYVFCLNPIMEEKELLYSTQYITD